MYKLINPFIYTPVALLFACIVFTLLKFLDETSSFSQIPSNPWLVIPSMILISIDMVALGLMDIFVSRMFKSNYIKVPIFSAFTVYQIFILITIVVDEENSKETLQQSSQYYYSTYVFKLSSFYNDIMTIIGKKQTDDGASAMFGGLIQRSPGHWSVIFIGGGVTLIFIILCVAKQIFDMQKQKKQSISEPSSIQTSHSTQQDEREMSVLLVDNTKAKRVISKHRKSKYFLYYLTGFFTGLLIILFTVFMCTDTNQYKMSAPAHWNFYKSHLKPSFSTQRYLDQVANFRLQNPLQTGYDWIDQRSVPEYPTVYAPKKTVCAYNGNLSYCPNLLEPVQQAYDPPNIVVVIIESFTPSPLMIDTAVAKSSDSIVSGPLYKETYLPNLRALSEQSVSFASLSSSGLPTVFGWHSLITGELPYSDSLNMVQSIYNDVDDFPSFFRAQNYHTLYVSPSDFNFDGKHNWLLRGRPLKKKDPERLSEFPLWFDDVYQYFPTDQQAVQLNVDASKFKTWTPDRITSAQLKYHFDEAAKKGKPVLGVWATVETHMPFNGQDELKYYEPFKFGKGVEGNDKMKEKSDKYMTVAKYADHYIGDVIQHLKTTNNNTILVIVGDHGAREVPLFKDVFVDPKDPDSVHYDDSCNHQPFSNDQLFATSAVISYLGDNPTIKSNFAPLINKVIKAPTDHHDLIRTLYDFAEDATQKKLPSSRNGRNLMDLGKNLTTSTPLRKHWSLRATNLHSELATESTMYRYHSLGPYGQEFKGIYPTCVFEGEERPDINDGLYHQFAEYHRFFDYLQRNNKQFSYKFRNEACVYPAVCDFPENQKAFNRNDALLYAVIFAAGGLGLGILISLIGFGIIQCQEKRKQPKESIPDSTRAMDSMIQ
ncbi:Sulfatase [Hexamita inflata]|uniref:Sulfatase n=1 Tax=Hexamita inflata TaxID=28002 RepID=A0AA86RHN2_9EUKA|nr:Sulfatase [Hexamita inflata]